jgi:hypothetical protein
MDGGGLSQPVDSGLEVVYLEGHVSKRRTP